MESPIDNALRAISVFIRVLFCYADKSSELCIQLNLLIMKTYGLYLISALVLTGVLVSCETVDDDPQIHVDEENYVELSEVAQLFAGIPIQQCHLQEVHDAVCSSSGNGYDEEYTMKSLFESPGSGVGESVDTRSADKYQKPLRSLIQEHLLSTKASGSLPDPQRWLDELVRSDIQIYWPYSDNWDGVSFPIITFDPEDDSDANVGYRICVDKSGRHAVEEVIVDEAVAKSSPVWVINRNSDASFKTLEMLRKEDPNWGEGGGDIVVLPSSVTRSKTASKALVLKDFRMKNN